MPEPAKETVIIVHGTWAAPDPVKRRWYEPVDGRPGGEPFTTKSSTPPCKSAAHRPGAGRTVIAIQFLNGQAKNNWIARTRAASALADYVAKLQKEDWRCHIVAHSHGGNVVVEALPKIMAAQASDNRLSKLVTLGTPFIDTMSPILKRARRAQRILNVISWMSQNTFHIGRTT